MFSILKNFYPHEYAESVFAVDYRKAYDLGYRGIIFDIDNTLVHHGNDSTKKVDELFSFIHGIGLKTLLLSDNSRERIERFNKNIGTAYIPEAGKPDPAAFLRAVDMLCLERSRVLYIGDQIFKDIYGANKSSIACILVKFLRREGETKLGIRRRVESIVLALYRLRPDYRHRLRELAISPNAPMKEDK